MTTKVAVRARRRAQRREIATTRDPIADGKALARHALDLVTSLRLGPGSVVAAYDSLPSEPPTGALREALRVRGVEVLLPMTLPSWDLDWFTDTGSDEGVPLGLDAIARADLVLAPALAVDDAGGRLGQGGGCYDRTLPRLRPGTPVVAVVHPGEVSADPLPTDALDRRVDGVLTAEGLRWFAADDRPTSSPG
ncbi:5-formyltetrahydrofolate cyclo-ligase [Janibacter sp. G1551]|uniref:5-formyltetrahydrofolate cyclo-ligase n=1 Tax=Janibacter sp. G1551 TaxID=3420440 RepID=UPI003D051846